ncbi:MAG TPA: hypothetical protein VGS19_28615 [Streptosporangiaceae bacterium]|nr:hypothetical protein [Streptosporangiaceae bacterium]
MTSWVWIVIIIAVLAVVATAAAQTARWRKTNELRREFGPEYDRAVAVFDNRRAAEANLCARQERRARLEVRPLSDTARQGFAAEWHGVQECFVDQPEQAVTAAGILVARVMVQRGYVSDDQQSRVDLLSVDYPDAIDDYRTAAGIQRQAKNGQADTEDLRKAIVHYRSLFEALLGGEEPTPSDGGVPGTSSTAPGRR